MKLPENFIYLVALVAFIGVGVAWCRDVLSVPWRIYYFLYGLSVRHRTSCPDVLAEKHDIKRLMKLLPYIAASFTPVIMVVPRRKLILVTLSYFYWRILDTFDDLLAGDERKRGLGILQNRLDSLVRFSSAPPENQIGQFHFSEVGPRDNIYIRIVQNLARLDSPFVQLSAVQRDSLLRFVSHQTSAFVWPHHQHIKSEQEFLHKCVSTIMTGLYFATFEVNQSRYGHQLDQKTRLQMEDVCVAFSTGNIIKDLEKDFLQGISYHPELQPRGVVDEIFLAEMDKIYQAREFLCYYGIQRLPATCQFFKSEWNQGFFTKFMALSLKTHLLNNYKKYWCAVTGRKYQKPDSRSVLLTCFSRALLGWETAIMELDQNVQEWQSTVQSPWQESQNS